MISKEEFDKKDADMKVASGIFSATHIETNEVVWSFFVTMVFRNKPPLELESAICFKTEAEAEKQCAEVCPVLGMALQKAMLRGDFTDFDACMEKYQFYHPEPEPKPSHLSVAK